MENICLWRRTRGFTLIELMIVILIIAILVAIAVPVYLAITNRASRARAMANERLGSDAMNRIYLENSAEGNSAYIIPGTSNPIDATYLKTREPKVKWVDYDLDTGNWPLFADIPEDVKNGVLVVHLPENGNDTIVIAALSKDGHCWFSQYYTNQGPDSGDFDWADGPPG